jgi:putative ABC transport system permease protein
MRWEGADVERLIAICWMNLVNIRSRLGSSLVIVIGVAGVVGVLTALLALAQGFQSALVTAGADDRAMIMRESATTELTSGLSQEAVDIVADAPGVARNAEGNPVTSAELLLVVDLPKLASDSTANLSVRGVGPNAPALRDSFAITEGRMFEPGRAELIVGRGAASQFAGLAVGSTLSTKGTEWRVVGIFTTGGDVFESEVWGDAPLVQGAFRRGNSYQSVRVQLEDAVAFDGFKQALADDPRVNLEVVRESAYYADQSSVTTNLIRSFGIAVGLIMAFGAIFGALNTMFTAVSTRTVEIATLRALGFGSLEVVASVMVESWLLAALGGVLGGVIVFLVLDGFTVSTLNNSTFSQVAFAFTVTPALLTVGIVLALVLGFIGGLAPALRAATLPVTDALRER